ncbi:restriction endonuclease subunit S [Kaistia terrae]|uniref:Restriction endonuclease subunit S n=1 Tax=Kaistia terrae TaxID=537017 RepID=A0ABW0Q2C4_9HYPH|nr:restriction endonuclease subunit S [Kaistia terrae]MCX5579638.1 restriction endonuclease subunit S [Kaistia terrae]
MLEALSSFADIYYGKSPAGVVVEEGDVPVYGTGGVYGKASKSLFSGPAVIIPRKGSLSRPHFSEGPFWASDTTYAAIPKRDVDAQWLYYQLCQFDLESLNEATGVPSISRDWLAKSSLLLQDMESQTTIVRVLRGIDSQIEATEALIAKQERVRAGLMQDLFTRGVDEHGQLRRPREEVPDLYHQTELGWLPKGWEVSVLKDKGPTNGGHLKTGPFGSSLKIEHWVARGRPVITIGSLGEGILEHEELLYVSEETATRLEAYQLAPGDVVFSRVADVGRSVVIEPENSGWIMSSNLMRIRLNATRVNPRYLYLQLAFDVVLRAQIRRSINTGGRDVANAAVLNSLKFAWPSPDEQGQFIEVAGKIASQIRSSKEEFLKLRLQKSGLMQDLLTGKISVAPLLESAAA